MPRFSVAFGRRKSTADELQNAEVAPEPSFRVLERVDVASGKSFDGGARLARATTTATVFPQMNLQQTPDEEEDNMFADLKVNQVNRGSGSSNITTKTASTDASSRHSNVSTAPSSADLAHHGGQEEWKGLAKRPDTSGDMAGPTFTKPPSRGFLERAGRTFSFGANKKNAHPITPVDDDPMPPMPTKEQEDGLSRRSRGFTSSTASTATPPKLDDQPDFSLDMGSDFGQMFDNKFKRNSAMTLRAMALAQEDEDSSPSAPRSLTANRPGQAAPAPLQIDKATDVEPSPCSWTSEHSNDNLLNSVPSGSTSTPIDRQPPPVPNHSASGALGLGRRTSDIVEDDDARLLRDSLAATRYLDGRTQASQPPPHQPSSMGRFRRNEDPGDRKNGLLEKAEGKTDDNMFEGSLARSRFSSRHTHTFISRGTGPTRNKVMTPAEFERYREDKERQSGSSQGGKAPVANDESDEGEDNYEDDEDEAEKAKQAVRQRRRQEAHMTIYRQQMMKVTGESNNQSSRPTFTHSMSSPNLMNAAAAAALESGHRKSDDDEDEDDEIPLAILAAHGFPNKNKAPNRVSTMPSNPDLRASTLLQPQQQQQPARPGSSLGDNSANSPNKRHSTLPAFARKLPQDPFLGAGLVNGPSRESMNMSGGAPAPAAQGPATPGGLVGVIASEERSRAMRRGSPHIDSQHLNPGGNHFVAGSPGYDPIQGIPQHMMYNQGASMGGAMPHMSSQMRLSPGDQAQIQMTQQMQQFMQMQMQFMQMMSGGGNNHGSQPNNGDQMDSGLSGRRMSHMPTPSIRDMGSHQSFMGGGDMMGQPMSPAMMDHMQQQQQPRPGMDPRMRTMSMLQPSSESWIQPGAGGYAPSIHAPGHGYTPSIAPSERSNVGLPGRYRPVSQAAATAPAPPSHISGQFGPGQGQGLDFPATCRTSTMSGALGGWGGQQSTIRSVGKKTPSPPLGSRTSVLGLASSAKQNGVYGGNNHGKDDDDDDDEQGWEAMRAKRDKKRSIWRSKKTLEGDFGAIIS